MLIRKTQNRHQFAAAIGTNHIDQNHNRFENLRREFTLMIIEIACMRLEITSLHLANSSLQKLSKMPDQSKIN